MKDAESAPRLRGHVLQRLRVPASPYQLAVFRIVLGLYVVWVHTSASWEILMAVGGAPNRLTNTVVPPGAEAWLHASLVPVAIPFTIAAAILLSAGLVTRLSSVATLAGFLVTHHFYYRQCHFHDEWPYLWFFLLVMALAPCADRWSVDAWLAERRGTTVPSWWGRDRHYQRMLAELDAKAPVDHSVRYRWPIELMLTWWALIYVAAGTSKLLPLLKGEQWLEGDTVHRLIAMRYFDSPLHWAFGRPLFDYGDPTIFAVLAKLTILVELAGVLVLLSRRAAPAVYVLMVGLHVNIYLSGVPGFLSSAYLCGLLFAPDRWFHRLATLVHARTGAGSATI